MPGPKNIPQEIQQQYDWVFPASITHMEILHAAYRTRNPNAAFFIRDPGFLENIPPEMEPAFVDGFPLSNASLKVSTVHFGGCPYDMLFALFLPLMVILPRKNREK